LNVSQNANMAGAQNTVMKDKPCSNTVMVETAI